jgi:hypothetical protein
VSSSRRWARKPTTQGATTLADDSMAVLEIVRKVIEESNVLRVEPPAPDAATYRDRAVGLDPAPNPRDTRGDSYMYRTGIGQPHGRPTLGRQLKIIEGLLGLRILTRTAIVTLARAAPPPTLVPAPWRVTRVSSPSLDQ